MKWRVPNIPEKALPKNFSIWVYLLVFVLSAIFFEFIVLLINENSVLSNLLLGGFYLVIVPLFFSLSITGFIYSYYHSQLIEALFFNLNIKNKLARWQIWARKSIGLVDYCYLTEIDNLALKVMGLEGSQPMNPDKVMPISVIHEMSSSPLFYVFEKIIMPMKAKINSLSKIKVLLNMTQSSEAAVMILANYCRSNHININESDIVLSDCIPSPEIIHEWIDTKYDESILMINLVYDVKNQLSFSEYCCALLFSNVKKALNLSKLRVFRPLKTELTDLSDDIGYLIKAEQVEKKRVNQLWTTSLSSSALNILKETFFDINGEIIIAPNKVYPLDLNLGKLSESHAWLALALAADGVNQGQKGQMIASQGSNEIYIMQLSDRTIQRIEENDELLIFPTVYFFSLVFCLYSIVALLAVNYIELKEILSIIVLSTFLSVIAVCIPLYFKLQRYQEEFDEIWFESFR